MYVYHIYSDCVTLVRPLTDESQLQKLNTLPWTQLRPEFRTQVEALRSLVLSTAKGKQISGNYLNGPSFVSLAMAYVDVMNNGAVPTIQSAWESVVAQNSRDALDQGLATFAKELKNGLPDERTVLEHDAIVTLIRNAEAAAVSCSISFSLPYHNLWLVYLEGVMWCLFCLLKLSFGLGFCDRCVRFVNVQSVTKPIHNR
jgi:hypothetical protein